MGIPRFLKKFFADPNFQRKKAFLKSLELFTDLDNSDLGHLVQSLHSRTYHPGEVLFVEGDIGRALFILESGRVELTRADNGGKERVIYTLEPGEFFGEMALLEQLPRTASARATEKSQLHLLYRSKLEGILHYYPKIGVSIMTHLAQILSARLRRMTNAAAPEERTKAANG
ncbi:MAG: cyclic nucleotide-binding domain-containing protein [Elusimicrobiota bacterium]